MLLFVFTSPEKSALVSWEERLSEECLEQAMGADGLTFVERGGGLLLKREEVDIAMLEAVEVYLQYLWAGFPLLCRQYILFLSKCSI